MPIPSGPVPPALVIITLANAQEIATRMGKTIDEENLVLAEFIVTGRAGIPLMVDFDASALDSVDLHWLQNAVVAQAIWLPGQPDITERLDVSQTSTDGDAMHLNHDALLLAPLAKWFLIKTRFLQSSWTDVAPAGMVLDQGRVSTDVGFRQWSGF